MPNAEGGAWDFVQLALLDFFQPTLFGDTKALTKTGHGHFCFHDHSPSIRLAVPAPGSLLVLCSFPDDFHR